MWQNAIGADGIFDDNDQFIEDADDFVNHPERNGFVRVRFHWSEDPQKDEEWYNQQKKDLNFDTRLINQELDLVFVGSTSCIFDDDYLSKLTPQKPIDRIKLKHGATMNLFVNRNNLDKTDFLLIGCDTAKSLAGDYSAIEIFSYGTFTQIGEYFDRLGSLTKYSDIIMQLVDILEPLMNNRLILCIENNSIGAAIIENLENAEKDYIQYLYSPSPDKYLGINTNSKTKTAMVSHLYDLISEDPDNIKSSDLINQLNIIERKSNGSISAQSGYNDDLFMSCGLCAYVKKLSALEYEPLLGISTLMSQQNAARKITSALAISQDQINTSDKISVKYNKEEGGMEYLIYEDKEDSDDLNIETPFAFL